MYRRKNIIIIVMCISLLLLVTGYAAFSTGLNITSTGNITSTWNVYFETITTKSTTGYAKNAVEPSKTGTSASFSVEVKAPGDKIVYEIILKNAGTVDAVVNSISATQEGLNLINYTIVGIKKGDIVKRNSTKTITLTVEFDKEATRLPTDSFSSLVIDINCVQNTGNVTSEDLIINRLENTLIDGQTFSATLKNFVNNSSTHTYKSEDTKITYIGFYEYELPEGYTRERLESLPSVSVSSNNNVKSYNDNGKIYIYIYSVNPIIANASMYSMFRGMTALTEIDLRVLDTSNTTSMQTMFGNCSSLVNLDLSSFDTSKVSKMSSMFSGCSSLVKIDLSSFNTSKVTNMSGMFSGCSSLATLDISNFDSSRVTEVSYMFNNDSALKTIYVSTLWNLSSVTSSKNAIGGCSSIVGGAGTKFNSNYVDVTYLRIDKAGTPGYFTYKANA